MQWAIDNDIQWKFTLAKEAGAGIGGLARVPVKKGEDVVEVPKHLIVSNKRARTQLGSHFAIVPFSTIKIIFYVINENILKKGLAKCFGN